MDQGWMYCSKPPDPKFVNGVYSFVKTARTYCINKLQADDLVYCPCVDVVFDALLDMQDKKCNFLPYNR